MICLQAKWYEITNDTESIFGCSGIVLPLVHGQCADSRRDHCDYIHHQLLDGSDLLIFIPIVVLDDPLQKIFQ